MEMIWMCSSFKKFPLSFLSEQLALGDDGCVSFWVGHPKEGLYGLLSNDRAEIVFQEPDKFAFERSNGVPLRQMRLTSSMPPDFFVGSKSGDPMLAFKGSEGCELTIQIVRFLFEFVFIHNS
jgi:hypothetical protein